MEKQKLPSNFTKYWALPTTMNLVLDSRNMLFFVCCLPWFCCFFPLLSISTFCFLLLIIFPSSSCFLSSVLRFFPIFLALLLFPCCLIFFILSLFLKFSLFLALYSFYLVQIENKKASVQATRNMKSWPIASLPPKPLNFQVKSWLCTAFWIILWKWCKIQQWIVGLCRTDCVV